MKIQFYFQFLDSCDIDRSASFYISIHHVNLFQLLNQNEILFLFLDPCSIDRSNSCDIDLPGEFEAMH
ncbi:unnamed protein product [Rotaria sp. Silwood2]|nr:unnamed protein product [Rotaria sp. Silwood2]CAF2949331.1 unnamed protein product [Rotaria sp. Silwood2]CAF4314791.1 unnamed protein product [Rotaria sp. Silwood2]CAF4337856.1 unnamed protein product [Rotaria sp. Silwood2]